MIAIGTTASSFAFHFLVDYLASCFPPSCISSTTRQRQCSESKGLFIWRNSVLSCVHASVTGIGALFAFYLHPDMSKDLIFAQSSFSISLVAYSLGYFIADSVHMCWWSLERSTFELLVHHFAVMTCFSSALVSGTYIGYAVVALLVEINSIFLHMRRLLKCLEFSKDSLLSQFVNYANLGTFIVFRFLVLCWMTRWLVLNRDQISLPYYCLGTTCLALIMFMNIVLFMRLVQSDVLSRDSAVGAATLVASTHVTTNSSSAFKRKTVHQSHDSQSVSLCASD
ncbi:TLC domain-containing protein 2 [Clonorchis sinensis]|uniref:TLC domain-containing protein 2 n=2 Tax=Clonorchis sinensis TaxID=79923 RepID=A0A8T1M8G6_CLOSI|nr:TLC domain-containing protein 2 [Clonorchis sinensis]